jgi:Pectate lyase superfamily protein
VTLVNRSNCVERIGRPARMMNPSSLRDRLMGPQTILLATLLIVVMKTSGIGEIIPANRMIPWSRAIVGVPKGIPGRTTIFADVTKRPYNADNTGASDASAAIQAAINACPANQVVYIPAGTYKVGGLRFQPAQNNITLRGAGESTVLVSTQSGGQSLILVGGDTDEQAPISITSPPAQGGTQMTLSSASGLGVGWIGYINENNDNTLVWDGGGHEGVMQQVVRITAIKGDVISFAPASYLNWNSSLSPRFHHMAGYQVQGIGLENFTIDSSNAKSTSVISFDQCYGCWLSGIKSVKASNFHFWAVQSLQCEIRECTAWDSQRHSANGGGVVLQAKCSGFLVEDNIIYRTFPGVQVNSGSGGNVFSYNYMRDNYTDSKLMGASYECCHYPHCMMDLYEGNVGSQFQHDGWGGSGSHMTLFRNYFYGTNEEGLTQASKCIDIGRWGQYFNVVGNVLGTEGVSAEYSETTPNYPYTTAVIYRLGYPNGGNNYYTSGLFVPPSTDYAAALDTRVQSTILRHGNYDYVTKSTVWDPSISDQTLPASLYLTSKPAWFGNLGWPPIGPDKTPMAGTIPAEARFLGMNYNSMLSAPTGLRVSSP